MAVGVTINVKNILNVTKECRKVDRNPVAIRYFFLSEVARRRWLVSFSLCVCMCVCVCVCVCVWLKLL